MNKLQQGARKLGLALLDFVYLSHCLACGAALREAREYFYVRGAGGRYSSSLGLAAGSVAARWKWKAKVVLTVLAGNPSSSALW